MWQWTGLTTSAGRRRWRRGMLCGLLLAVALVVLGPMLLAWRPVRQVVVGLATRDLNGTVEMGSLNLAWWSAPQADQIVVTPRGTQPLLNVQRVECQQSMWNMLWNTRDMGRVVVEHPQVRLVATKDGLNLRELLRPAVAPQPHDAAPGEAANARPAALPPLARRIGMQFQIHQAEVVFRGVDGEHDWRVGQIDVSAALRPPQEAEDSPEFVVEPGPLVTHADLSVGLCRDVLKFVAPILADVTYVRGDVSAELTACRVPLDRPATLELAGNVSLHAVEAGPGPLVRDLAGRLGIPAMIELAREMHVQFQVRDGCVEHRDLEFGLGRLVRVKTSGTVGFDQSLDLVAEVRLYVEGDLAAARPVLAAFSDKPLRLAVRGTLQKPQIDTRELTQTGLSAVLGALAELQQNPAAEGTGNIERVVGLIDQLIRGKPPAEPAAPVVGPELIAPQTPADPQTAEPKPPPDARPPAVSPETTAQQVDAALDMAAAAAQILHDLVERRRQRREGQPSPPAAPTAPPADESATAPQAAPAAPPEGEPSETAPERRRPLLNLLERLRQQRQQQPESPPPQPPAAP